MDNLLSLYTEDKMTDPAFIGKLIELGRANPNSRSLAEFGLQVLGENLSPQIPDVDEFGSFYNMYRDAVDIGDTQMQDFLEKYMDSKYGVNFGGLGTTATKLNNAQKAAYDSLMELYAVDPENDYKKNYINQQVVDALKGNPLLASEYMQTEIPWGGAGGRWDRATEQLAQRQSGYRQNTGNILGNTSDYFGTAMPEFFRTLFNVDEQKRKQVFGF